MREVSFSLAAVILCFGCGGAPPASSSPQAMASAPAPTPAALTLSPSTASAGPAELCPTIQFTASEAVSWSVVGQGGSIDSSGLFKGCVRGTFQINATSLADPERHASAQATVYGLE